MAGVSEEVGEERALAGAANFAVHAGWAAARIPGMRVVADAGLTVVDSGLVCDTFNFVCRARLQERLGERIARVIEGFGGRPFSWWVGPSDRPLDLGRALLAAGFVEAEGELDMAADLGGLREERAPLRIERVRTLEGIRDFARVLAANWDPPDPEVPRFYERAAGVLLADAPLRFYVGYVGEEAVAAAECTVAAGVAGLYNIATRATFRGRGFGRAMTLRPLLDARSEGVRTAVLQAAPDGVSLYRRLGFRETGRWTEYKLPSGD